MSSRRSADSPSEPLAVAVARASLGRPKTVLLATLAVVALAGWRVARLRLDTDFSTLLPASDPAVTVLKEMSHRMPALSSLDVVVQGPDAAANRRYVDALAARLRALGDPAIDDVQSSVRDEQAFFARNRFLYADAATLENARERLDRAVAARKNPMLVDLDGGERLPDIERSFARAGPFDQFPDGYFAYKDGSLYAVVVWLKGSFFGDGPGNLAAERIRAVARALSDEQRNPGQRVGLTGNVITAAEERAALASDLAFATTICVVLVGLVVILFFGRPGAILYMVAPAACGVACALAFAQLAFGFLNGATGFMGSIIVGNGINYAIVQMARYEEERRRGRPVDEAATIAVATTWRATGLAALAAAIAYGSLAITDFRGFNQFGWIGGVGMLLAWLATTVVLPASWRAFDRRPLGATVPRLRGFALARPLGRFVLARPRAVIAIGLAVTALASLPLPRFLRDPFEYDFDKLRNQVAKGSDSEVLSSKLDPIFGRSLSPSFVFADQPSQAGEIRALLVERDRPLHVLGAVKTIDDFLPGTVEEQTRKLALIDRIRRTLDDNGQYLDADERAALDRLRPPDGLRALAAADLPSSVRRFYTEADGTVGRVIAYFPRTDVNVWDGRIQMKLASIVRDVRLADGKRVRSSGWAVIFAAMIDAVVHDGPIVTIVSFCAVLALLLMLARRQGAYLVAGSLLVGVWWMVGGVAAAGVRLNFLNFIALPITFGIAADYGANLYLRYREEGAGGLAEAVSSTGGAVILCSLTTVIGYAALLVADTEGLRTFGAAAILGELSCVTTAVVMMPAAIALIERRRRKRAFSTETAAEAAAREAPL